VKRLKKENVSALEATSLVLCPLSN
jgi:hypothetical protein